MMQYGIGNDRERGGERVPEASIENRSERPAEPGATRRVLVPRACFVRGLGLVYLVAFASFWSQAEGLVGSRGILPVADHLRWAREQLGSAAWWHLPTVLWLDAGDPALHALCAAGCAAALLALAGIAPAPALASCWLAYLSVYVAGQQFLSYQWDVLLLEAGVLAVLWAPLGWRPRRVWDEPPSRAVTWLLRWLIFRLMWSSGVVKLLSGDPAWRGLTAMEHHYQTQPIPTWTSWFAHHLPGSVHTAETLWLFGVELILPLAVFGPRRLRLAAAAGFALLQLGIAATGNYGFFNLLTLVLCLPLLDDAAFGRLAGASTETGNGRRWPRWLLWPAAAVILCLSSLQLAATLRLDVGRAGPLFELQRWLRPLHLSSSYGLFAVMTTTRPEIVLEGSRDGVEWRTYRFRYKPTEVTVRPSFAGPHMPRLDWQMWFAALRGFERAPWFGAFATRLLEGSGPVLGLLAADPFADGPPPRYLRAHLFEYRFSRGEERRRGVWWQRTFLRPYAPVLSLRRD